MTVRHPILREPEDDGSGFAVTSPSFPGRSAVDALPCAPIEAVQTIEAAQWRR